MKNIFAGVGISKLNDPEEAAKEAVGTAIKNMQKNGGKKAVFGVLFCSAKKYAENDASIKKLVGSADKLFKCVWIGCTTAGELSNYGFSTGSCVALTVSSDYIHIGVSAIDGVSKDPRKVTAAATKGAVENLKKSLKITPYRITQPNYLITLFPGTTKKELGHEEEALAGVLDVLGSSVPIVGGSAGDDAQFKQTYQFANGKVYKDAVVIACLFSRAKMFHYVDHGYKPTKKVVTVTDSEGKIVRTLNNEPAAKVYSALVGTTLDKMKENIVPYIAKYPLGFSDGMGNFWIKNPQAVLPDNSLLFFSPVPKNSVLYLLKGTQKDIIKASDRISKNMSFMIKNPAFSIIVSCAGRSFYLQDSVCKEYENIKKNLKRTPFIGFYSYSEQATLPTGQTGSFCQTIVDITASDEAIQ